MSSEIRANTLKNRVGLGTVSYTDTGIIVSGIVTANSFKGDGSSLTGIDATTLKDSAGNIKIQAQASGAVFTGIHTFTGDVYANEGVFLPDSKALKIGNTEGTPDFTISHDTSNTILDNNTGDLILRGDGDDVKILAEDDIVLRDNDDSTNFIHCINGAGVRLYNAGNEKLYTSNTGVSITGDLSVSGNISPGGIFNLTGDIIHTDDTNTKFGFGGGDDTFRVQTGGSTRLHIHTDGRFRVGCTAQPSGTVGGFQLDMGSYPGTLRLMSGAGASGTQTASLAIGGSNHHANLHNGANSGGKLDLYNYNSTDGNSTSVSFHNSNGLAIARILGVNISHSSRNGALVFMTSTANYPTEKMRVDHDGRVLIGTTTEGQATADDLTIATSGTTGITIRSGTGNDGNIYFSDGTSGSDEFRGYIQYGHSSNDMVFGTNAVERLRIRADGELRINHTQSSTPLNNTFISIWDANSDSSAIDASGVSKNYAMISLHNYGTGIVGDTTGIGFGAGTGFSYTKGSIAFQRTGSYGLGDLVFLTNNDSDTTMVNEGDERMRITKEGDIYGPGGGRKNWFDNGSFDCRGGRRNATSMDYGNHHAYGWVTDRFMSRNSVQWTRSTNVPTGKGFSYSTQTNGAGGQIMQAVELPDYGDMGVFTPGSYWCVSIWSTVGMNHSGSAFSYDLGPTYTSVPGVGSGSYATTGETAAGTSTGTFNRYYRVYGPMPSSIISGATGLYFQWGFTGAGYSTGWQLERVPTSTSKPTPYEHVHPAVTTARCRRYCWQNVNSRLMNGYKRHDSNIHWQEQCPVPPTHMPSGSNQSVSPYGIILHDGGLLSNFQSVLQNPGVNSLSISEFDYRSGRFIIVGSTSYSPTHTTVPAWESQEYEVQHGFF